jgi:hypothetical protein
VDVVDLVDLVDLVDVVDVVDLVKLKPENKVFQNSILPKVINCALAMHNHQLLTTILPKTINWDFVFQSLIINH